MSEEKKFRPEPSPEQQALLDQFKRASMDMEGAEGGVTALPGTPAGTFPGGTTDPELAKAAYPAGYRREQHFPPPKRENLDADAQGLKAARENAWLGCKRGFYVGFSLLWLCVETTWRLWFPGRKKE